MKKKIVVPIFTGILIALLFIFAPSQTQVSAQDSEESIQSTQTKTITKTEVYGLNKPVKSSIPYNVAGWSGTLYLVNTQSTGDHILATYRGTVHCSEFVEWYPSGCR
ncbi:hypothetical protein [Paracerasibacillus soli]|uniref:Uncharacterized protein n=1 Tax=Paracerasibacillus soli TaxID=480284 RepID=A0ABU5CU86_9BACI|nr:hypothetical protein [Virgibacillus soli]MDY0409000.1 hypothetical protein [Virgibacillus soli]